MKQRPRKLSIICLSLIPCITWWGCMLDPEGEVFPTGEAEMALSDFGLRTDTLEVSVRDGSVASRPPMVGTLVNVYRRVNTYGVLAWYGSYETDVNGEARFKATDLDRGVAYQLRVQSLVTREYKLSSWITSSGHHEFVVGNPPLTVTLSDAMSNAVLAAESVNVYELFGDGTSEWRARKSTDQSGMARFDLDGLGQGRRYQLRMEPYSAGAVWTEGLTAPGSIEVSVGTSPVKLVDAASQSPLSGVRLIAYLLDGGSRKYYKEGITDSTGTVRFDFEALRAGGAIVVQAKNPLGTGEDFESAEIQQAGQVTITAGSVPGQPDPDPDPDPTPAPLACGSTAPSGTVYYVDDQGSNSSGDGSRSKPWATITHALTQVTDGSTILVGAGTYQGVTRLSGRFSQGVLVRSEIPYTARLRTSSDQAVRCFDCQGIALEGFDIAHAGRGAGPLVIQIQGSNTRDVTLRNNILHDSYNNDLLKINNGATNITIERNLFYNQSGSDEHIDINSVSDVIIQDNVFFNSFAASGRANNNNTSAYIVIKDSNGSDDQLVGAQRITVRRNVFLNWEGSSGYNFVLVGEDAASYIEAKEILVENNLFLGNSSNQIRAPFGVKSGADVTFRNNTVVGNMPGRAFAMRVNAENSSVQNEDIRFYNNIWSDPTGSMGRFSTTPSGETASFVLDNNVYWNGGASIPMNTSDLINYSNDVKAIEADPLLGDPSNVVVPSWDGQSFADGSSDICEVFHDLVVEHGTPGAGSSAIDAARADHAPDHDILGRTRSNPDIGAVELSQ